MDSAKIAIQSASLDLTIFNTLHQTMVYAVSLHSDIGSLWLKVSYSLSYSPKPY
jgi:hypothetical protein